MNSARWPAHVRLASAEEPRNVVIVGGGISAHRCAFDLRKNGYTGDVTMVSKELVPAYDRTLLSKDMLEEGDLSAPVFLSQPDSYREADIDLVLGRRADVLDIDQRCIELDDGATRSFDRLVLSVGGRPVLPAALDAPGVLAVREIADLDRLRTAMSPGTHMAIIGGGFIGGEIATAATRYGLQVTLVEAAAQPLAPLFGEEAGARVAALHQERGVKVLNRTTASEVKATSGGFEVRFTDGVRLAADSVVVGIGMRPDTDWLNDTDLEIDGGIITDANCQTSVETVFAAGDCARWWHPEYEELCRVEHWDTANRHGAAVAKAVLGDQQQFAPLPFFWSEQHGVKLQFAGRAHSWDEVRVDGDSPTEFAARYYTSGKLSGTLVAGQPRLFAQMRRDLVAEVKEPA